MRAVKLRAESQVAKASPDAMELVSKARESALGMMRDAGYDIGKNVEVVIDPKLPFMGYTHPQRGGFKIVVSGGAVESGLLEDCWFMKCHTSTVYEHDTHHTTQQYYRKALKILEEWSPTRRRYCLTF